MAEKTKKTKEKIREKTRHITITESQGAFSAIFRFGAKQKYEFSGISALRQLLSNEKARILHTLKTKNPKSIYELSKFLGRNFKSVRDDLTLLDRFGFIEFIREKKGKREMLKPLLAIDKLNITFQI